MGRKRRFGDLQRTLNMLRSATSNDNEGDAPDAPPGTRLRFYQDWKKGGRTVTYNRENDSNPGKLEEAKIELFSVSGTANKATVPVSKRAKDGATAVGLPPGLLGWGNDATTFLGSVVPAKITVYLGGTREATATRSKLTGTPYKPRTNSKSYTLPFGKTGTDSYAEKARALITAAKGASTVVGASCRPEDVIIN